IAAPTSRLNRFDPATLRLVSKPRRSNGSRRGTRSTNTKPVKAITAPASDSNVAGETHPACAVRTMPYTSKVMPAVESKPPATSGLCALGQAVAGNGVPGQCDCGKSNRHVEKHDPSPARILGDRNAQHDAQCGTERVDRTLDTTGT